MLSQRTSFNNDWKLISIFIGGNDLCAIGRDPIGASPEVYVEEIEKALDIMHTEVSLIDRIFFSLVTLRYAQIFV